VTGRHVSRSHGSHGGRYSPGPGRGTEANAVSALTTLNHVKERLVKERLMKERLMKERLIEERLIEERQLIAGRLPVISLL
jgi:hypothetical protein